MRNILFSATAAAALLAGTAAVAQSTAPAAPPSPAAGAAATQPAGPAAAPAAPAATGSGPTAGATVYDAQGNEVGKIEAVEGQYATLATAKSKARLPLASFGTSPKGPTLGMTAAEVDAAAGPQGSQAASASPAAGGPARPAPAGGATGTASAADTGAAATTVAGPVKLTKGATISDPAGAKVGTVEEVSGEFAVVATGKNKVRLPLNAFADSANGPVIGMTAAELDAAAASAAKPKTGR